MKLVLKLKFQCLSNKKALDEIVYNFTTSIDDLMEMDQFTIEEGEKVQFTAQSDPQTDGLMRITVEGSAVKFENGELFALEEGSAQIIVSIEDQQRVINVLVTEGLGPVISLKEGVLTSDLTASWNEEIDVLAGLDAIDSCHQCFDYFINARNTIKEFYCQYYYHS